MLSHKKGTAGKGIEEKQRECFLMREGDSRDKAKDKLEVSFLNFTSKQEGDRESSSMMFHLFFSYLSPRFITFL